MQQADMAVHTGHDLAVEIENHTKDAVGGRMLRTEIQCELSVFHFGDVRGVSHYSEDSSAFSSPGI